MNVTNETSREENLGRRGRREEVAQRREGEEEEGGGREGEPFGSDGGTLWRARWPIHIVSPFQTAPIIFVQRPPGKEETHAQQYTSQVSSIFNSGIILINT